MMDKNLPRNSPLTIGILVGLGVLLLTVLIGLFVLAGVLLKPLMTAAPGKPPEPIPCCAMLTAILIVLVVIAVLLMLLLWRCCRGGNSKDLPPGLQQLLAFLPQLTQIPGAIRKTAKALHHTSAGLGAINGRLQQAGAFFSGLSTAFSLPTSVDELPIPGIPTKDVTVPKFDNPTESQTLKVINGNLNLDSKVKFATVKNALVGAGTPLQDQTVVIATVCQDLDTAAGALDLIATALGAPP